MTCGRKVSRQPGWFGARGSCISWDALSGSCTGKRRPLRSFLRESRQISSARVFQRRRSMLFRIGRTNLCIAPSLLIPGWQKTSAWPGASTWCSQGSSVWRRAWTWYWMRQTSYLICRMCSLSWWATHVYGGRGRRGGSDPYDGFGCNLPIGKRQGTGGCSPPTSRYAADSAGRYGPGRSGYLSCVLQPVGPLGPLRDDSLGIGPGQDLKVGVGMRVLILGASGMLGHKLWQVFRDRFETWGTVRSSYRGYARYNFFDPERLLGG